MCAHYAKEDEMNMNKFRSQVCSALLSLVMTAVLAGGASAAGPDLLGIRIGMTPEEALSILKARAPKETWQTVTAQLMFRSIKNPGVPMANVPNGTYRAALINKPRANWDDRYYVFLTPTPGKERVAAVLRSQNYQIGQDRPLFDPVIAGLIEKFGKPTHRKGSGSNDYNFIFWAYDADGKPRTLGTVNQDGNPCTQGVTLPFDARSAAEWSLMYSPVTTVAIKGKEMKVSYVTSCGDTIVRAFVQPAGKGFAALMNVELIGHALTTAGKEYAVKLID
jgi:hypothetical protein